jgi:ATP-dependent DNA ligase
MLKRKDAPYRVGRKKGDWWKWKVDPFTIDAVLTYAMRGHGRRTNLFTDYTFALWDENKSGERELVTFAKAYSGLTDAELRQIDAWIKKTPWNASDPSVRSLLTTFLKLPLRVSLFQSGIKVGLPPDFRGFCAGEKTNPLKRPIPFPI